jgi:hypothetical protein
VNPPSPLSLPPLPKDPKLQEEKKKRKTNSPMRGRDYHFKIANSVRV